MKKILLTLIALCSFSLNTYAGGGLTHMYIANGVIDAAKKKDSEFYNPKLSNLLRDNLDAYLVGAYYPDSGYTEGAGYGEVSHWDPFIYAFADYLKTKYKDPVAENPKLVAFLFGCAAHRVSDEIQHRTFYPVVADNDFKGNSSKAHSYADTGIDLLLNVEKSLWTAQPSTWWVPVKDLLEVYKNMGEKVTAEEIEKGNQVLVLAGYGERVISLPAYYYVKWQMPWTAKNYYEWPTGGIEMDEQKVAAYQADLWKRLYDKAPAVKAQKNMTLKSKRENPPALRLSQSVLASGNVAVPVNKKADGAIELQSPRISPSILQEFKAALLAIVTK